ncbi:MAG: hypothetical protein AAGK33_12160 [Pseudomonadota bacterium]
MRYQLDDQADQKGLAPHLLLDAYTHFNRALAQAIGRGGQAQDKYLPLFVRSRKRRCDDGREPAEIEAYFRDAFCAVFEPHELEILAKTPQDQPYTFFVYVPAEHFHANDYGKEGPWQKLHGDGKFLVLNIGLPVKPNIENQSPVTGSDTCRDADAVVAVIDDGIGFLNRRFTDAHFNTRFECVWLQSSAGVEGGSTRLGRELTRAEIQPLLARNSEAETYREINRTLLAPLENRSTEFAFSHGTHVMDLAAGADPLFGHGDDEETVRNWPLMAVQLPPETVEDTSGLRMRTHVVAGVRWLLHRATTRFNSPPRMVINISLGALAGPKDGSGFLEYQIAREIEAYDGEAHVVYSYGNNYRSRQVAVFEDVKRETAIDWMIQPDDFTPSYLEIRLKEPDAVFDDRLEVVLTSPQGQSFSMKGDRKKNGFITAPNGGNARLYFSAPFALSDDVTTPAVMVAAMAPTAAFDAVSPVAAAGRWRVKLINGGKKPLSVTMQIQRDDTPTGYRVRGRQSYFDHPTALGVKVGRDDQPGTPIPLSNAGTNSAFTTVHAVTNDVVRQRIHTVGAASIDRTTQPGTYRPSPYTAAGADWSGNGPSGSAVVDQQGGRQGVLASGTLTGSTRRLTGTSAAAPLYARQIALELSDQTGSPTIPTNGVLENRLGKLVLTADTR